MQVHAEAASDLRFYVLCKRGDVTLVTAAMVDHDERMALRDADGSEAETLEAGSFDQPASGQFDAAIRLWEVGGCRELVEDRR